MTQVQETQVQAAFVTLITHLDLNGSKKVYSGVLSDNYIPQEKSNEKFQVVYSESLKTIKTQVGCSHITALQSQPFSAQQVLCRRIFSPIARIFSYNGQLFVLNDDEIHCGLFHSDRLHSLQEYSKLTAMEHRLTTYKANMIADAIFNKNNYLNNPEIKILIEEARKEVPDLESLPSQVTKISVPGTSDFHMLVNFTPFPFFLHSTQKSPSGILTSFFYCFDAINEFNNYNGGEYNIVYCDKQKQVILLNYDTKSKKIERIILSNEITGALSGTCKNYIFFDITDCDTEVTSLTLKQTGTNKTITPKIVKIGPHRWRCFYEQEFDINALFKKDAPSRSSLSFEATINEKIQMPLGSLMTDGNFSFTTHSAKAVTAQTITLNDAARSQEDDIPEWMKMD